MLVILYVLVAIYPTFEKVGFGATCDILPRLKSWASSPYFMACCSCFYGDSFSKSYVVSTGVNSGLSDRTETEFGMQYMSLSSGSLKLSPFIPALKRWVFWRHDL